MAADRSSFKIQQEKGSGGLVGGRRMRSEDKAIFAIFCILLFSKTR